MKPDIIFNPWIGPKYPGKYGKLLIFGESHYTGEEEFSEPNDLTTKVVEKFLNKQASWKFFSNLGLLFNNENQYELWENVAFANAIQRGLINSNTNPTSEDILTVIPAFWKILELVKPNKVLICSKRMWHGWIPDNDERVSFLKPISVNDKKSAIWKYKYSNGECLAMGINHPSKYFSYNGWAPLVKDFLRL